MYIYDIFHSTSPDTSIAAATTTTNVAVVVFLIVVVHMYNNFQYGRLTMSERRDFIISSAIVLYYRNGS